MKDETTVILITLVAMAGVIGFLIGLYQPPSCSINQEYYTAYIEDGCSGEGYSDDTTESDLIR